MLFCPIMNGLGPIPFIILPSEQDGIMFFPLSHGVVRLLPSNGRIATGFLRVSLLVSSPFSRRRTA